MVQPHLWCSSSFFANRFHLSNTSQMKYELECVTNGRVKEIEFNNHFVQTFRKRKKNQSTNETLIYPMSFPEPYSHILANYKNDSTFLFFLLLFLREYFWCCSCLILKPSMEMEWNVEQTNFTFSEMMRDPVLLTTMQNNISPILQFQIKPQHLNFGKVRIDGHMQRHIQKQLKSFSQTFQ